MHYVHVYILALYMLDCIYTHTHTCANSQGPMTVVVQEFDGSFTHTIQVEESITSHELQCHSKIRK